jgi:hypothetical protein
LLPLIPIVETGSRQDSLPADHLRVLMPFGDAVLAKGNRPTTDAGDQDRQAQQGPSIQEKPQHMTRFEVGARPTAHRRPRIAPLPPDSKDRPLIGFPCAFSALGGRRLQVLDLDHAF